MSSMAMGPWGEVAKAGAGFLGGIFSPSIKKFTPPPQLTDFASRKEWAAAVQRYWQDMATGKTPLMSQADINRQVSGSYGRLDADARAERQRIMERSMGTQGRLGGMETASMDELGRSLLGQKRQLEAGVQNTLAQQAPAMRLAYGQANMGFLGNEQNTANQMALQQYQVDAARKAQGSPLFRGVMGAAGALGGGGGQQGGGGSGGGFSLAPFTGNFASGSWSNPNQPASTSGGYGYFGDPNAGAIGTTPSWNPHDAQPWGEQSYWNLPRATALHL